MTTKNGYAISKMEAVEAPRIFMLEKIKKLANAANAKEIIMSSHNLPEVPERDANAFF